MSDDRTTETAEPRAVEIAAKATGLRTDQIERAVAEYRSAAKAIEIEPEWVGLMHMSGREMAIAQYAAEGTNVTLQIDSWIERGTWRSERCYVFKGQPFEHYSEARAVELSESTRPRPYVVS